MSAVKNLSIRLAAVGGDKVRQEFKNLGADGDKAFRRITQVITPANDNLKALETTARSFNDVIRQGTALFGAYLGFQGLKNTFSAIFQANNSFEQLSGSLKTVTGSAKGAQEAFALIEKFAIDTPYQLNEIVEAFSCFCPCPSTRIGSQITDSIRYGKFINFNIPYLFNNA